MISSFLKVFNVQQYCSIGCFNHPNAPSQSKNHCKVKRKVYKDAELLMSKLEKLLEPKTSLRWRYEPLYILQTSSLLCEKRYEHEISSRYDHGRIILMIMTLTGIIIMIE